MSISLLCDEHISLSIIKGLCRRGIDAVSIHELNLLSEDDKKIIEKAKKEGRVVYTRDADFLRIHSKNFSHRGIIYNHPLKYSVGETIKKLEIICQTVTAEEMKNKVKFL